MADRSDTIFLTHSLKPYLHLAAAGICFFLAIGFGYERNSALSVAASFATLAFLWAAFLRRHPKARLDGTLLSIRETNGKRSRWDLRDITGWEIISDAVFDGPGSRSRFRGDADTNDNPAIALRFPGGKQVIARCYFDRNLQKDLITYCVRKKRGLATGKPGLFRVMYPISETEISDLLKRVS